MYFSFAEVSDNGSLRLWDRRYEQKPLLLKYQAHSFAITSLAWSPNQEWTLATASKDKTVKVWDCNGFNVEYAASTSHSATNEIVLDAETPKLIATLHTPSELTKVSWTSDVFGAKISPLGGFLTTVSDCDSENIRIWDIDFPNVPYLILKGVHQDSCKTSGGGGVTDFLWLDFDDSNDQNYIQQSLLQAIGTFKVSQESKSVSKSKALVRSSDSLGYTNMNNNTTLRKQRFLISMSKDGKLDIFDSLHAYHPIERISSTVATISCCNL